MKRIIITVISVFIILSATFFLWSGPRRVANFEKRMRCEDRCRDQWWQCRQKAAAFRDTKKRERATRICQTFFATCMTRCQHYE